MGKLKDITKTTAGLFLASTAKDAFAQEKHAGTLGEKVLLKTAGSAAAATAFHLLKDDVTDVLRQVGAGGKKTKLIED